MTKRTLDRYVWELYITKWVVLCCWLPMDVSWKVLKNFSVICNLLLSCAYIYLMNGLPTSKLFCIQQAGYSTIKSCELLLGGYTTHRSVDPSERSLISKRRWLIMRWYYFFLFINSLLVLLFWWFLLLVVGIVICIIRWCDEIYVREGVELIQPSDHLSWNISKS